MKKLISTLAVVFFLASPAYAEGARDVSPGLVAEGQGALGNGDLSDALKYFEQAMVADPTNIEAYIGMGQTFDAAGSPTLGLKYFTIALEIDPTNLPALELQGLTYLKTDSIAEATANLEKMKTVCLKGNCAEIGRLEKALESAALEDAKDGENSF